MSHTVNSYCMTNDWVKIKQNESELVDFVEISTADALDNIFIDIAAEANLSLLDAKNNIQIHGSSPILLVKDYLLGNVFYTNVYTVYILYNIVNEFRFAKFIDYGIVLTFSTFFFNYTFSYTFLLKVNESFRVNDKGRASHTEQFYTKS